MLIYLMSALVHAVAAIAFRIPIRRCAASASFSLNICFLQLFLYYLYSFWRIHCIHTYVFVLFQIKNCIVVNIYVFPATQRSAEMNAFVIIIT